MNKFAIIWNYIIRRESYLTICAALVIPGVLGLALTVSDLIQTGELYETQTEFALVVLAVGGALYILRDRLSS